MKITKTRGWELLGFSRVLEKFWEIPRRLCTDWRYAMSRQAAAQFK